MGTTIIRRGFALLLPVAGFALLSSSVASAGGGGDTNVTVNIDCSNYVAAANECEQKLNKCEFDQDQTVAQYNDVAQDLSVAQDLYNTCTADLSASQNAYNTCTADLTVAQDLYNTCTQQQNQLQAQLAVAKAAQDQYQTQYNTCKQHQKQAQAQLQAQLQAQAQAQAQLQAAICKFQDCWGDARSTRARQSCFDDFVGSTSELDSAPQCDQ